MTDVQTLEPLSQTELSPLIAAATQVLVAAKGALRDALSEAQSGCEHRFVSEVPYQASEYGLSLSAHRICNHCRLTEEGSHWSGGSTWSRRGHGDSVLGNIQGRIVLPIDRDEFCKMRIVP